MPHFLRLRTLLRQSLAWLRRHPLRGGLALLLTLGLLADQLFPLPLPRNESAQVVLASDGSSLRSWPGRDGIWRHPVAIEAVSPLYLEALLGYEDRWFHYHPGVNPVALLRAALQWARHGRIISGGSTLSMQVARIIEPPSRNLGGKLRQILRALQLELHFSKREILGLYLNRAPMGGIVEGVEMASRMYLGKPSSHLSAAEAALLVVLPQAPSRLRPDRFPAQAQQARDKVLKRMAELGVWTPAVVEDARIERVGVNPLRARWVAPLAAERLRQLHAGRHAPLIRSTLDAETQSTVERLLQDRVEQLPPRVSMAVLVMETASLEVRAYAGSADFSDAQRFNHVDMVRGLRSPGSTLKPFLYAMALDEGLIHSESLLSDAPQSFAGYEPGNFQANFSGPVSVAEALQRSLNVPAVDLLDRLGPQRFAALLHNGGLPLRLPAGSEPNLSIILGGAGARLEELVGAYRALAAGGLSGQPRLTPEAPRIERRIMSEGAAFIVRDILETGGHPDRPFHEGATHRLAWKTGTSFGFRDAWAIGVSDSHTVGVWVGRPDGTPNPGFFGANIAAPLLRELIAALPAGPATPRQRPASVSTATICWPLGTALDATPAEYCPEKRTAWILAGAIPPTLPERDARPGLVETAWINPVNGLRTSPACQPSAQTREILRWPAHLEPWLSPARQSVLEWDPACRQALGVGPLRLHGIASGARLRATPGRREAELSLHASGASGRVYWLLDGALLRPASTDGNLLLRLNTPGEHHLSVVDDAGRHAGAHFEFRRD
ncbi:penicillin-binding protein 1C [Uliginosibacterium sp. TH139]|uniref:penicillin-binding protein 1C n=1 Tax=Uliginosibacterium sp. TH139 TaxID=2067453 RepID=UPI000C796932|nr:penicillin-binding protein 1C [Uliginosibacterium sp. TH139]PLK47585.1 penicillin-binding protein 1C [Uliginosibacterium sp. TH139]